MNRRALFLHASADLYGSDLACLEVAKEAIRRGWAVEVTLPGPGPLQSEMERAGAAVHHLDPLKPRRADLRARVLGGTAVRWLRNYRHVRRLSNLQPFDVVYSTTAPTLAGFVLARRWGARHIYHVHELFWFPRPLVRAFERLLRRADLVVHCSRAVCEQFRDPQIRDRSLVAPTGAVLDTAMPDASSPLSEGVPRLVCVARLNEWKGQEVLVDAVALLRERGYDVELLLVGDVYRGQDHFRRDIERRIAARGIEDVVTLTGERRDALEIVARSDVFVLPSRRPEPFGMALVEAMALGRPCIATAAGGPTEIVNDGVDGILVPPDDREALAGALRHLLDDPERARAMGEAARRRARDFPITAMATAVVDGFEADPGRPHHSESAS